jgi:hypothetical protein
VIKIKKLLKYLCLGFFAGAVSLIPNKIKAEEPKEKAIIVENMFLEDVIDTVNVIDSKEQDILIEGEIEEEDVNSDPAALHQDVFRHMIATEPLVDSYGPFSAQISVKGLRPQNTGARIDNLLMLYKKDSYHNLFSLPRGDIFKSNFNKNGFSSIDFSTDNQKKGTGFAFGLLDISAYNNLSVSGVNFFNYLLKNQ